MSHSKKQEEPSAVEFYNTARSKEPFLFLSILRQDTHEAGETAQNLITELHTGSIEFSQKREQ